VLPPFIDNVLINFCLGDDDGCLGSNAFRLNRGGDSNMKLSKKGLDGPVLGETKACRTSVALGRAQVSTVIISMTISIELWEIWLQCSLGKLTIPSRFLSITDLGSFEPKGMWPDSIT
jgi:hypothetical protein